VNQVVSVEQILSAQEAVREVYMDEKIEIYFRYIFATRYPEKYKLAELKPLISWFFSSWKYQFSCCS
jgi:MoxR-like ATPase